MTDGADWIQKELGIVAEDLQRSGPQTLMKWKSGCNLCALELSMVYAWVKADEEDEERPRALLVNDKKWMLKHKLEPLLRAFRMVIRTTLLLCLQIAAQLPCFGLPGPSLEGAILGFTCRLTRKCAAHLVRLPQAAWVILCMSCPSPWRL